MLRYLGLAATALLLVPASARADGFMLKQGGGYLRETEQAAFIEWADGRETLYIHTRSEATKERSLWIVPIPGKPGDVTAEPVKQGPWVNFRYSVMGRLYARNLGHMQWTTFADLGLIPCFGIWSAMPSGADVHNRMESMGMVVETVTAPNAAAFDAYLKGKGFAAVPNEGAALAPYFGKDYVIICAWAVDSKEPMEARALRIEFPTPHVYYPLRPSSVYEKRIETSVLVRGWVRYPEGADRGIAKLDWVRGKVQSRPRSELSDEDRALPKFDSMEPLTHVVFTSEPSEWTDDLVLEPAPPSGILVADQLAKHEYWEILGSAILAIGLSPILAWRVIPRERRQQSDWLAAAGIGLSLLVTIFLASALFATWCRRRGLTGAPTHTGRMPSRSTDNDCKPGWGLPAKIVFWIYSIIVVGSALYIWTMTIATRYSDPKVILAPFLIAAVLIPVMLGLWWNIAVAYRRAGRLAIWFFVFVGLHFAAVAGAWGALLGILRWQLGS